MSTIKYEYKIIIMKECFIRTSIKQLHAVYRLEDYIQAGTISHIPFPSTQLKWRFSIISCDFKLFRQQQINVIFLQGGRTNLVCDRNETAALVSWTDFGIPMVSALSLETLIHSFNMISFSLVSCQLRLAPIQSITSISGRVFTLLDRCITSKTFFLFDHDSLLLHIAYCF